MSRVSYFVSRLNDFVTKADWGRFSIKLAPIFIGFGIVVGLFVSKVTTSGPWECVASGVLGACLGGYLLPRMWDIYGRGPLVAQVANGVFSALLAALLLPAALSYLF